MNTAAKIQLFSLCCVKKSRKNLTSTKTEKKIQCTIAIYSIQYSCCITAIPLSLGVGGRGLCVDEAGLTHEMRAEANEMKWNLTMPNEKEMSVAKNRAGKAASSRTEASSKIAERSGVLCLLAIVRGASRQRVERGWLTEIARNGAKRNEGADSPISPSDPQAITTISGVLPLYKYSVRVANTLMGLKGAKSSRG